MIKFKFKTIILSSLFIFLFSTVVIGQYTGPKQIVVGDVSTNNYQVIYPLDWSENGIFAYMHQDMNVLSSVEIYSHTVIFQNMETNKILWTKHIVSNLEIYNHFPSDNTLHNYAFFKLVLWNLHGQDIEDKLKLYNIERGNSNLHKITDLPKRFSIKENKTTNDNDSKITIGYDIRLFKPYQFKPVYDYDCYKVNASCNLTESIGYRHFTVRGYFKSPFENRIAILVFKETNGFEEPFEYPFFVGTHLEKGFIDIGCYQ